MTDPTPAPASSSAPTAAGSGRRIYVASSWRNTHQPEVVEQAEKLKAAVAKARMGLTGDGPSHAR